MSRKSSWWLRPQRKGASNRAALNEANHFMEHNKVLRERINELTAENAKLRELVRIAVMYCDSGTCDECPILGEDKYCPYSDMARELGVEVDW